MKTFFTGIFALFTVVLTAQYKTGYIPTYTNDQQLPDTAFTAKSKFALAKALSLPNLQISTDSFHYRLWTDIQAIDIWKTGGHCHGVVTNYARRYNAKLFSKGMHTIDKLFSNQFTLDSNLAIYIFYLMDSLHIASIPPGDQIAGWGHGFDGIDYFIETSSQSNYYFKTYWTPSIFASVLPEAASIHFLIDRLFTDFKIDRYYDRLRLPEGRYERNGIPGVQVRIMNSTLSRNSILDGL